MAKLDIEQGSLTNLKNAVKTYSVDLGRVDEGEPNNYYWDYPYSSTYLGYYKYIPHFKRALDTLAVWTVGKGYETDIPTQVRLDDINGWGEDSFIQILWQLQVMKKVQGCAFAEIIRDDKNKVINLKPLYTGNMRVIVDKRGIISGYEHRVHGKEPQTFKPYEIFHISNERVANEIHGTSVIESMKWIIDAWNEALDTQRKTERRQLALGVMEVDTEDESKISAIASKYQTAVNNGEVLITMKGLTELKDSPSSAGKDKLEWIRYLENAFYQAVGVPRIMATSEGFTEAGGKVGFLTFEPVYSFEQKQLEADLWNQLAIKIKFNRPPSLQGTVEREEQQNTGQVGFQPNDTTAGVNRE